MKRMMQRQKPGSGLSAIDRLKVRINKGRRAAKRKKQLARRRDMRGSFFSRTFVPCARVW